MKKAFVGLRSVSGLMVCVALLWGAITVGSVHAQAPAGPAAVPATAKKMKAPVPSSPAEIADGKVLFGKYCRFCHGENGEGGKTAPSLTDKQWTRGSSEGEIFWVIQNGAPPKYNMKGFKGTLSDESIWKVVHYVRSLGGVSK